MSLEDLEKQLYRPGGSLGRTPPQEKKSSWPPQRPQEKNASQWGSREAPSPSMPPEKRPRLRLHKPPASIRKVLFFATIALAAASSFAVYAYLVNINQEKTATLSLDGPPEVLLGVPFELNAQIANGSLALHDARLEVLLPSAVRVIGAFDQYIFSKELGVIEGERALQEPLRLIALSGEKSAQEITVKLSYSTRNVSSRFTQERRFVVNVGEAGIRLDATYPNKVLSGEEFNLDFLYRNVSQTPFDRASLIIEYPKDFEFVAANKPSSPNNTTWDLGSLAPNDSNKITILGKVFGREGAFFTVVGKLVVHYQGHSFVASERTATFAVAPSPLAIDVRVNGSASYVAHPDDQLSYEVTYKNNTDAGLKDVVVKAQLAGEMFDLSTLSTNAFFESVNNTITWNAARAPELRLLQPGAEGTVRFSIRTKKQYPIRKISDRNYALRVRATIESPTVPFFVASEKTIGVTELETKVRGALAIDAQAFFRDADSGILNAGLFPPKVNTPTQYTVHWVVKAYASDIRTITLRGFLESGVTWTGVTQSNLGSSVPTFNERTSEVMWIIDRLTANRGIVNEPAETIFQIEATPSLLVAENFMPLTSAVSATAIDDFSGVELSTSDEEITTQLPDDPTISSQNAGRVLQ